VPLSLLTQLGSIPQGGSTASAPGCSGALVHPAKIIVNKGIQRRYVFIALL
jgi:hypothetical protein